MSRSETTPPESPRMRATAQSSGVPQSAPENGRGHSDSPTTLALVPITQTEAKAFVERHHRHSIPPLGSVFQIGLTADGEDICGVAIVGRPVARALDADPYTAEVLRLCTDGTPNACSKLYAACWRAARAMGYRKLITNK